MNEDELLIFYNTHEAIIDQETYDKAQKMRKRVSPRRNSEKPTHRLSGTAADVREIVSEYESGYYPEVCYKW